MQSLRGLSQLAFSLGAVLVGTLPLVVRQAAAQEPHYTFAMITHGQPVLTGPAFVDSSNIAEVAKFAKSGTR